MNRRSFLASILAAGAAPAIVRAASLMPIKAPPVWVPNQLLKGELGVYNDFKIIDGSPLTPGRRHYRDAARAAFGVWFAETMEGVYIQHLMSGDQWTQEQLRGPK